MSAEKGAIKSNAMPHHLHKTISVPIKKRKNNMLQFVIKGLSVS
jgi:hypothetical protein